MQEFDEVVMFSIRVQDQLNPAEGSVKRPCSDCGADLWISPAALQMIAEAEAANPAIKVTFACLIQVVIPDPRLN